MPGLEVCLDTRRKSQADSQRDGQAPWFGADCTMVSLSPMHMNAYVWEFGIRQEETVIQEKGTDKASCKTSGLNQSRLRTIQIESCPELIYPFRNQKLNKRSEVLKIPTHLDSNQRAHIESGLGQIWFPIGASEVLFRGRVKPISFTNMNRDPQLWMAENLELELYRSPTPAASYQYQYQVRSHAGHHTLTTRCMVPRSEND
jgi:hypothetical protein